MSPLALVLARAGLGALLLVALSARRGPLGWPRHTWRPLAVMGFVGVAFHGVLQAYALTLTTAVKTGWLIGLTPIWSALLARLTLGERLDGRKLAGLGLGFLGGLLVVTQGRPAEAAALPSTRGDLLILASTLNWALYTVIGHRTLRELGALRATAGALASGLAFLLVAFVAVGDGSAFAGLSPRGWAALLFLGLCCSGLGYLFWYGALEKMAASRVASLLYLEPLVTLGAAVALLGEPVHPVTVAGGVLLLGGVALVQRT